ncbi:MAG: lysylphosphatidylglycerol synthase transmembrane domain-containing protein [Lachnospiraceae bacterium]|nr:flippase-like domain-containing protein [Lachnospiraceae bacterium]MEE1342664.1 lysylphosphatidylglycerol synthase transmembrane domain-containing protein [Lachnospiraceae bacterium]
MSKKEKWINGIILAVCTLVTIGIFVNNDDIDQFPKLMRNTNFTYVWCAIVAMLLYVIFNGMVIKLSADYLKQNITFLQAVYVAFVGQYYSLVTPFASGGQPFQIYTMRSQYQIPIAKGTSITMQKCLIYQIIVPIMILLSYLLNFNMLKETYPQYFVVISVAVFINMLGTVPVVLLIYNIKWLVVLTKAICKGLKKIRLFRKLDAEKIINGIWEYDHAIQELKSSHGLWLKTSLITILQMVIYFSIPYLLFRALGAENISFIKSVCLQVIVYCVVSYIPTPGNAGASEGAFYVIYGAFLSSHILSFCMLLWRLITYYFMLGISGFVVVSQYLIVGSRKESVELNEQEYT